MEIYVLVLSLATLGGQAYSCCLPQQLEGTVGMSIGLKNNGNPLAITAVYDKWAMDTAKGKGYLSGTVFVGGHAIHQEIVQDFNNQIQYEAALGNCTVKPLPFEFRTEGGMICLPPSSKVMSSYHGLGEDTLNVDTYYIPFDAGHLTMSLTTKGCAPVSEGFQTNDGIFNIGFMGLTSGITDQSVFELPSPCKEESMKKREIRQSPFVPI
ncbi:uncharacterized protein LOC127719640 [Mytilus californianus]|uniref:uncharacterized protein LOC127719640 n=1 Tax=Mytilus californianus TaxID=6549 RepID=UPI002245EF34|nr:uncharacterized protein LOC127719640 [Mytilus californianus]